MTLPLFQDPPTKVLIDIPSSWRRKRVTRDSDSQTDPITSKESAIQSKHYTTVPIQTDAEEVSQADVLANQGDGRVFEYDAVVAFLERVEGLVSAQLMQNVKSTAFHGYIVKWSEDIDTTSLVSTFSHAESPSESQCTDVCWSKSGGALAVAYGRWDHMSWCSHKGMVCVWTPMQRDAQTTHAGFAAETSACCMSIAFHPEVPSLLVGGLFNGEIVLWRTSSDGQMQDAVVCSSVMSDWSHQEPVSSVAWIATERRGKFDVLSMGTDGKILVWDVTNKFATPKIATSLLFRHIPRHLRGTNVLPKIESSVGVTCGALLKGQDNYYLVGTETGGIFKCTRMNAVQPTSKKLSVVPQMNNDNPIVFSYIPHVGPVQQISVSPFHRNLFLTCGTDGTVRLYNQLESKYLRIWEPASSGLTSSDPIVSVKWSPFHPTVFSCTNSQGYVYFYNLSTKSTETTSKVEKPSSLSQCITLDSTDRSNCIGAFNPKLPEWYATCTSNGQVKIWRLSTNITDSSDSFASTTILNEFGNINTASN